VTPATPTPFFERPPDGPPPAGRLLLLSYHFPPSAAAGALRWQKFARYAAERGWGLDVITLHPAEVPNPDWDRLEELPEGTRVFGVPRPRLLRERLIDGTWEYMKVLRRGPLPVRRSQPQRPEPGDAPPTARRRRPATLAVRTYNSLLDYGVGRRWARDAARLSALVGNAARHRAVVTCGPPHTIHLAGRWLHRRRGMPFVMDMRDPWSLVERLSEPIDCATWRRLARHYERRAVPEAALIIANTDASRDALRERYPALASRIVTVMNGFDEDPIPRHAPDRRFVIAYAGTIYLDRDPRPLFDAAAVVVKRYGLTPNEFGIRLVGTVANFADRSVAELVRQAGLEGFVEIEGQRCRRELWDILGRAAVLVSLPQDSHLAIPSKVFEYMQFEAWILAMAEPGSATAQLLGETAAAVVGGTDVPRIAEILDDWYRRHRRGERPSRIADERRFGRRHQAGLMFDYLERVLGGAASP
jgi:hypothetical protein